MISFSSIGNSLHIIILGNMILYGSMLYQHANVNGDSNGNGGIFDDEWLQRGFCTPHQNFDGHTTHDYSGYIMAFISLLGIAIQQYLSRCTTTSVNNPSLSKADSMTFWALVGALGHAWGHLFIAYGIRQDFYPPAKQTFLDDLRHNSSSVWSAMGKVVPGYPLFWMPLVATYMQNTAKDHVALVALLCQLGSLFMQVRFGFSYTQSVLFVGMSIDQLMLPQKDKGFEYALWPLLTTLPNALLGWIEATSCTSNTVLQQHGHVIYDVYMASSYVVFYLICWIRANYIVVKAKTL